MLIQAFVLEITYKSCFLGLFFFVLKYFSSINVGFSHHAFNGSTPALEVQAV